MILLLRHQAEAKDSWHIMFRQIKSASFIGVCIQSKEELFGNGGAIIVCAK